MQDKKNKNTDKKNFRKVVLVLMLIVSLLAGFLLIRELNIHKKQSTSGQVGSVKNQPTGKVSAPDENTNPSSQSDSTNQNIPEKSSSEGGTSSLLLKPTGNFVSNHYPGKNGAPTSMVSACNTTSGAMCNITFRSSSNITKDLGSKKADANGSTIWSWDINGSGMAPGDWTITATATLNGQSLSTVDPIKLQVQP